MFTISSDSFGAYGLHRIFRFVKQADFSGIEIAMTRDYDTQNAEYIKELSQEFDLPVVAISAPVRSSKSSILKSVEMAKYLECKVVAIQPPQLLDFKLSGWIKSQIPSMRKKEKIHICLENTDASTFLAILPKYAMNSINDLISFKSVCLDTANLASKKVDLMRVYSKLKNVVKHVHISNARSGKDHLFPDKGILPLESLLKNLCENKYQGAISLKLRPSALNAGHDDKVLEKLKAAKDYLEKYFKSE